MSVLCYPARLRSRDDHKTVSKRTGDRSLTCASTPRIDGIKRQLDADWGGAELPEKACRCVGGTRVAVACYCTRRSDIRANGRCTLPAARRFGHRLRRGERTLLRKVTVEMIGQDAHVRVRKDAQVIARQVVHAQLTTHEGAEAQAFLERPLL